MIDRLTPARTPETDKLADYWLREHLPHCEPAMVPGVELARSAFAAGMAQRVTTAILSGDKAELTADVLLRYADGVGPLTTADARRAAEVVLSLHHRAQPQNRPAERTPAIDALFDQWARERYVNSPDPLGGKWSPEEARECFAAGLSHQTSRMMQSLSALSNGIGLMNEAAQLFREYEAHHVKASRDPKINPLARMDRHEKAERNARMAEKLEGFLLDDATPRDRIAGLALSLVQDLGDADYNTRQEIEALESFTRLRDAIDQSPSGPRNPVEPDPVVDALRESFAGSALADSPPGKISGALAGLTGTADGMINHGDGTATFTGVRWDPRRQPYRVEVIKDPSRPDLEQLIDDAFPAVRFVNWLATRPTDEIVRLTVLELVDRARGALGDDGYPVEKHLRTTLRHQAEEIGKLHSRVAALGAANAVGVATYGNEARGRAIEAICRFSTCEPPYGNTVDAVATALGLRRAGA